LAPPRGKGDDGALAMIKAVDTDVEFAELFVVDERRERSSPGTVRIRSAASGRRWPGRRTMPTRQRQAQATGALAKLFVK
jgi:hypothetical protein